MWDDSAQMAIIGIAIAVGLIARRRRRSRDTATPQVSPESVEVESSAKRTNSADGHEPVDSSKVVIRSPESVRIVAISSGPRTSQFARCVECTVGGRPATEVVRINAVGEDLGDPEYLWEYSIERAVRQLVG